MGKRKVRRFRVFDGHGNPHDIEIGYRNIMERYQSLQELDASEKIIDIYYEEVNHGNHGIAYIVAVYPSYEQRFIASRVDYFECEKATS